MSSRTVSGLLACLGALTTSIAAFAQPAALPLKFQFGSNQAAPGFTLVRPDRIYSEATGHGFEPGASLQALPPRTGVANGQSAITSDGPFAFSVAVPEGNYRVTVTLGHPTEPSTATVKAERRRLMLEKVETGPGEFTTHSFLVNVRTPAISSGGQVNLNGRERDPATGAIVSQSWDEKLTVGFSNAQPSVASIEIERADDVVTLFLTGDSTVTDQARGGSWGQMAPRWFGPGVVVANHAESGETLRGFLRHRRWDKILDSIKAGDYVLIEFGTNDSKDSGPQNLYAGQDFSETHAPAATIYREMLLRFVTDVRAMGGIPIIASPSARRDETRNPSSLSEYAAAAMDTAARLAVPAINLHGMGLQMNAGLGDQAGLQFADRTHHSEYGAYLQAKAVVSGIKQMDLPLAQLVVDDFGVFDPRNPRPRPDEFSLPNDVRAGRP